MKNTRTRGNKKKINDENRLLSEREQAREIIAEHDQLNEIENERERERDRRAFAA